MNSGYQHLCLWNYHVPWLGPRLCDLPTHTLALGQKTKTRLWICLHGCHKELDRNNSFSEQSGCTLNAWSQGLVDIILRTQITTQKLWGVHTPLELAGILFFACNVYCVFALVPGAGLPSPEPWAGNSVRSFPANPQLRLSFPGALS